MLLEGAVQADLRNHHDKMTFKTTARTLRVWLNCVQRMALAALFNAVLVGSNLAGAGDVRQTEAVARGHRCTRG
jgi:hypothetical protein